MSNPTEGKITTCATSGCSWLCCQFQQGNFIVLHPGELETAKANGQSTAHLQITDPDYNGGQKAVCTAKDTANCDNGLKPLDCKSYPFFPTVSDGADEIGFLIKGKKCPLQVEHLAPHMATVKSDWDAIIAKSPEIAAWLRKVELVGYTERPAALKKG